MQKKAAGHRSAKRSFLLCISLPCGNEGIAGFLGIGKSWNSANRGVRNNHTKPTIKPVCRLGKLAEFLGKSRRNDRKSNEIRWTKSTTRVLLSERPRVRIAVDAPKKKKCCHLRVNRHFFFVCKARRAALCGIISVRLCISHCKALPAAHSESQQSIPPISD